MQTKTFYQTDGNGFFIHKIKVFETPLEPGKFANPYRAHDSSPPPIGEGQAARWVDGKWIIGEDHRNDTLYVVETSAQYAIGDAVVVNGVEAIYDGFGVLPSWLTATKPELPPATPDELIKAGIAAIEEEITARRMREAVLGRDEGWLAAKDAEIAALRAQL
jgi:hypothetical protein